MGSVLHKQEILLKISLFFGSSPVFLLFCLVSYELIVFFEQEKSKSMTIYNDFILCK